MFIMTSHDVPKEVFIEDVIDHVVRVGKTQLIDIIYPEYDPAYRRSSDGNSQ